MKKIFSLIILICLLLSGCNKKTEVTPQIKNLTFSVHSVKDNNEYLLNASTNASGALFLSVIEPANIKNLKLSSSKESVILYYLDLEKEIPLKSLEEDSIFKILFCAFDSALNCNILCLEENLYFNNFILGKKNYKMFFSQSGLPLKITETGSDFEILFKGITILN